MPNEQPLIIPVPKNTEDNSVKLKFETLPPLHSIFVGKTGSRKSNLLINLILRNKKFGYLSYDYQKIYIISPSLCYDQTFDIFNEYKPKKNKKGKLIEADIELVDEFNDIILEDILNEIKEQYDADNKKRTLVLLDDCVNEIAGNTHNLTLLFTRGRHYKISTWVSTQAYKKIPKTVRTNAIDIFIFGGSSKYELKDLYEEFGTDTYEAFYKLYQRATKDKYSFLGIRTRYGDEERYTSNLKIIN